MFEHFNVYIKVLVVDSYERLWGNNGLIKDSFNLVLIYECAKSSYNLWRKTHMYVISSIININLQHMGE